MWSETGERVFAAIKEASADDAALVNEYALQAAVASALGQCEREVRIAFAPPVLPWRCPPASAIDQIAAKSNSKRLPVGGIDPCTPRAKLDILWHSPAGPTAIELKHCSAWKGDTSGYQFLKDLYRLERLVTAGNYTVPSQQRFAAFITQEAVYWRGGRPEPKPFWLTDGRQIEPGYWVQYDQPSPDTLWYSYPPFFLANRYDLKWRDLQAGWKCVLVPVTQQQRLG